MRKWIAAGCTAVLAAGVVACGSDDNGGSGSSSGSSSGGSGKKMTLIAGVKGDEFYLTMNCGAQAEAKAKGVTLDFQGPDKFDAVPADADRQCRRGQEAGRGADRADRHQGDVRADQAAGRRRLEDRPRRHDARRSDDGRLADLLRQREGRRDRRLGAVEADRRQRQGHGGQRQAGHLDHRRPRPRASRRARRRPGWTTSASSTTTTTRPRRPRSSPRRSRSTPDLKGIFAANLFSAEGAATALKQAGKLGKVKIVGFDAGPKQVEDLKAGLVQALIAQQPAQIGKDGVDQALAALDGDSRPPKIGTGLLRHHQGQPRPEPGRALQVDLLSGQHGVPVEWRAGLGRLALHGPLDQPVRLGRRVEDLVVVLDPEARQVVQQVVAVGQREAGAGDRRDWTPARPRPAGRA